MAKKAIQTMEELEQINLTVKDLSITDIIPNNIDDFVVNIIDGHHTIFLPLKANNRKRRISQDINCKEQKTSKIGLKIRNLKNENKVEL